MLDQLPDWKMLTREQKIEMVQPLVAEGLSSTQVAGRFRNVTRNTIIGICHRNKWQLKGGACRKPNEIANAKARKAKPVGQKGQPKVNAIINAARRRKLPTPPSFEPEPFDMEDGEGNDATPLLGLLQLNDHTCKYPVGDPLKPDFGFCGQHTDKGPYCDHHRARCTGMQGNRL